jgi:DNA polymerase III alpha subunit (gram-positive type)
MSHVIGPHSERAWRESNALLNAESPFLKTGAYLQTVFVDTETTGLDPDRHEIWEVACIYHEGNSWIERAWQLPVDLGKADPMALKISKFHERRKRVKEWTELDYFAANFAAITRGRHLAGAVVSFDEERLRKLLRANGACPEWHYHLIDVEALAIGYLAGKGKHFTLPWDSEDVSRALGIEPDTDRHEALYDAEWAKRIYEAVMFG